MDIIIIIIIAAAASSSVFTTHANPEPRAQCILTVQE